MGDTTSLVPGYPIRTSSDPRSVDSSPRHIAASHVLHRLSMPRHPPCALKHLQTQKPKFFKNCTKEHATHTGQRIPLMLATTIHKSNTTPHHQVRRQHPVLSQGPIVCPAIHAPHHKRRGKMLLCTRSAPLQQPTPSRLTPHEDAGRFSWWSLERR